MNWRRPASRPASRTGASGHQNKPAVKSPRRSFIHIAGAGLAPRSAQGCEFSLAHPNRHAPDASSQTAIERMRAIASGNPQAGHPYPFMIHPNFHKPPAALIFDMDGTMVDSMPLHRQSWVSFAQRYGVSMDLADPMRRTTGRTGTECMGELFGRPMTAEEALPYVQEKESLYRDLFTPVFAEVRGFKAFADQARTMSLKIGVGTAGDRDNIAFVMKPLAMAHAPEVIVGGDEGLPGKPESAIFLRAAHAMNTPASASIVFEDAPPGTEAARHACRGHLHHPQRR